ncbi:DUF4406 domain-containing protein [Caproiciproducens sp. CPB-2]|uniref:DUF4406 domain-containing protein n=1 Tax=Caproiciproducens sp. CPB-2 TaxID=3030017 RepID=UPI0023DA3F82|nr:DUF4406 domain-containing protein [Caproiciproducens sp. CPB-2]MDF1495206.1 DUF4406 domain-containing protein [Caproiciproducens sp. CPB-2]
MPVIYIAGPITGVEHYQWNFMNAQAHLEKLGYSVFNPAFMPPGLPHDSYMPICYRMMDVCDSVYFLSGWEHSEGAGLEFEYAAAKRMKMLFEKE